MLTLVMPYYENPGMLALHYANWERYDVPVSVVIVDDGSPTAPAVDVPRPDDLPPLEIYRVTEDRPWHQHAARNLGADRAPPGWMLLTDMDHMVTPSVATRLVSMLRRLDLSRAYMFDRVDADTLAPTLAANGRPKPHPNSFLMTRDKYWKVGGYDESFCGIYGTDALFRSRLGDLGHINLPLHRYHRAIVPDASTVGLERKEGRDPALKARLVQQRRGKPPVVLNFPWERVL